MAKIKIELVGTSSGYIRDITEKFIKAHVLRIL
jgi:hypothetical protein